jgi:hypothetical protein
MGTDRATVHGERAGRNRKSQSLPGSALALARGVHPVERFEDEAEILFRHPGA